MRKKKTFRNLFMGTALGLLMLSPVQISCSAVSQPEPAPPVDRFVLMDVNGDGKVVREEFQAAFPNMNENAFLLIDKNRDNGIERVEWEEFVQTHGAGMQKPPQGAPMNNIPGDPLIPPPDSDDLPLVRPPMN